MVLKRAELRGTSHFWAFWLEPLEEDTDRDLP